MTFLYILLIVGSYFLTVYLRISLVDKNKEPLIWENSESIRLANIRLGVLMKKANVASPDYLILCAYY